MRVDDVGLASIPENWLIAPNVPLDPLRLGSNSTRTTHSHYMARWNDLLGSLCIDGDILNPYWDKTKGQPALLIAVYAGGQAPTGRSMR